MVDYAVFPGGKAILTITGTRFFIEMVRQILGVLLFDLDPWPGLVGAYWASVADDLFDEIVPVLERDSISAVALFGHSQGGGICQLIPDLATETGGISVANLITLGAPRTGNTVYAAAQTSNYVRLTNAGDPVPHIPASISTPLDVFLWIIPPANLNSYEHWGTRFHLFFDGAVTVPPNLPSWLRGHEALLTAALASANWFADHRPAEYGRRLRLQLPRPFQEVHADYPGLKEIDDYFAGVISTPAVADWFSPPTCS